MRNVFLSLGCLLAAAAFVTPAPAQVPGEMNYQGFLTDDLGSPINDTVDLSFGIYDVAVGGSELWTESLTDVEVVDGVFSVVLGSGTPLTSSLFDGGDRFLETRVDGVPLFPRRPFLTAPYAYRAAVADEALSAGADEDWTVDGENVYRLPGDLGLGTDSPEADLHVRESADVNAHFLLEKAGGAKLMLKANVSGVTIGSDSDDEISFVTNNAVKMRVNTDGRVGVGTTNPSAQLDVDGDVESDHYVARNGLGDAATPAAGGIYQDNQVYAWARIRGDGVIEESYGIDNVVRFGAGWYRITLLRSLADASITVTPYSANDPVIATVSSFNGTNCEIKTRLYLNGNDGFEQSDYRFYIQFVGRP